eukprot:365033-Chlamydomonas_euryale.AAC.4
MLHADARIGARAAVLPPTDDDAPTQPDTTSSRSPAPRVRDACHRSPAEYDKHVPVEKEDRGWLAGVR